MKNISDNSIDCIICDLPLSDCRYVDDMNDSNKDNVVLISEYSMSEDRFECIWSKNVKCLQKSDRTTDDDRTEKLFLCKGRV